MWLPPSQLGWGGGTAAKMAACHMFPLRLPMYRFLAISPGVMSFILGFFFFLQILQRFHHTQYANKS